MHTLPKLKCSVLRFCSIRLANTQLLNSACIDVDSVLIVAHCEDLVVLASQYSWHVK